jgi:hypothetical protein
VTDNIVKPLIGIAGFVQGLRQALEFILGGKRKEERSGRGE